MGKKTYKYMFFIINFVSSVFTAELFGSSCPQHFMLTLC